MDIRFLLLLVCLCELSSPLLLLALQREASSLEISSQELLHQRSSHGPHNQEESRIQGSIKVPRGEIIHTQASGNGMSTHTRRLISQRSRQIFALKDEEDKEPKNKASGHEKTSASSKKAASADSKPLDEAGNDKSTNSEVKPPETGDNNTSKRTGAPPPLVTPEDKQSTVGKENKTIPNVKKPDDQVQDKSTVPDKKPNVPAIHCGESHCEDPKKLVSACLRIPGDGAHKLSLLITYDGASQVWVKIAAPEYLIADPLQVSVAKGKSETVQFLIDSTFDPRTLDSDTLNKTISVITEHGKCEIAVPVDYLRSSVVERKRQFSSYLTTVTPSVAAIIAGLLLAATLLGAWLCWKYCGRRRGAGDAKYQQLEMMAPGQSTPKERGDQRAEDGWDEVWDDDWDDAEAAKSSSRLSQNLSSRNMGGRRGNKDGWDNSWDD